MKKILVLYYTQSGQLKKICDSLLSPFTAENGYQIHFEEIKPINPFPFPWKAFDFFNAFPETFSQTPVLLQPLSVKALDDYQLIIFAYQPWFLSPSVPSVSFLQSPEGKKILNNKTVITILGCRNMWLGAQEKVKQKLQAANAKLVGHISLVDHSGNLTSLVTILRWMLTGKKNAFWFFPAAGVAEKDIEHASVYGNMVKQALEKNNFNFLQEQMNGAGAIEIKPNLVLLEKRGRKAFGVWTRFVKGGGEMGSSGRNIRVLMFMVLLPTLIFILSPLLFILSKVMLVVKRKKLLEEVAYHKQNSLR